MCLGPKNNPLHFGDDPDLGFSLRSGSIIILGDLYLGPRNNPLNFGDDRDYDPDPNGDTQSLSKERFCGVSDPVFACNWDGVSGRACRGFNQWFHVFIDFVMTINLRSGSISDHSVSLSLSQLRTSVVARRRLAVSDWLFSPIIMFLQFQCKWYSPWWIICPIQQCLGFSPGYHLGIFAHLAGDHISVMLYNWPLALCRAKQYLLFYK